MFSLVAIIHVFTCVKAYKVKSMPKVPSYPNDEELDSLDKFVLDNKYSNIPDEYVHQVRDFLQNQRRFSSISSGFLSMSSSQFCSRSVLDSTNSYVDPVYSEDGKKPSLNALDLKSTLTMTGKNGIDILSKISNEAFTRGRNKNIQANLLA